MSLPETLNTILKASSAVTAIVGARIYFPALPETLNEQPGSTDFPALSFTRVSGGGSPVHHSGACDVFESLVQFDCWSQTAKGAVDLAGAIKTLLHSYSDLSTGGKITLARIVNEIDLSEPELNSFRVIVEANIFYKN